MWQTCQGQAGPIPAPDEQKLVSPAEGTLQAGPGPSWGSQSRPQGPPRARTDSVQKPLEEPVGQAPLGRWNGFCKSPAPAPRSSLPTAHPNPSCERPPTAGPQFPPQALTHAPHTSPQSSQVPAPPPWARGRQSGPAHGCWTCPLIRRSCLSVPHDMLHMYTLPGGKQPGAWQEKSARRDAGAG